MEAGVWHRRTVYLLVGSLGEVQDAIAFLRRSQRFPSDLVSGDLLQDSENALDNTMD
jgi:hypothetical protein